jgi:serine phosphatase RsbU (regulator of sigma subunit)
MAVEPGLPLGMIGKLSYEETLYQIAPGDKLTFVSDGVVEATYFVKLLILLASPTGFEPLLSP